MNAGSPGDGPDARDWQAEAEELRRALERLRARMLGLARHMPREALELLEKDESELARPPRFWDLFDGWEDSAVLVKSDVETELRRLWARLAPPPEA